MGRKKSVLVIGTVMIMLLLTACGSSNGIPDSTDYPVEDFSFTNQDNGKLSLDELKGKVWVANFIFTNCADVCLPMTSNMSKLQLALESEGIEGVELVSFSVDPTVDSPEVLKAFGDNYNANYENWNFLTGYSQQLIEKFAVESFHTMVSKPETGDQVIHGTSFYLVDDKGIVVKSYNGLNEFPLDEILKHIKILQNY